MVKPAGGSSNQGALGSVYANPRSQPPLFGISSHFLLPAFLAVGEAGALHTGPPYSRLSSLSHAFGVLKMSLVIGLSSESLQERLTHTSHTFYMLLTCVWSIEFDT